MKHLAQLCAASVLTLALAFSTFAGDAECPGIVGPPPTPTLTQAIVIVIVDLLSLA
jgi:hypothetical protein